MMSIDKYFQKIQAGVGDVKLPGSGGLNIIELDERINSLKEEMKAYTERVMY